MRHKIAALAATTVFLAGGALATATSASASIVPPSGGWDHEWTTTDSNQGGTVYLAEYGDIVTLCDTASDGYSPYVQILEPNEDGAYERKYVLTASGGYGDCVTARASDAGGIHDLYEGGTFEVYLYLSQDELYRSQHYYVNDH